MVNAELWAVARAELEAKFQTGSVSILQAKALPSTPGVYVVEQGGEALYVGMSKSPRTRWDNHNVLIRDEVDRRSAVIFWALMTHAEAAAQEITLIEILQPRLNTTGVSANKPAIARRKACHFDPMAIVAARVLAGKVEKSAQDALGRYLDSGSRAEKKRDLACAADTTESIVSRVCAGSLPVTGKLFGALVGLDRSAGLDALNAIGDVLGVRFRSRPETVCGAKGVDACVSESMIASMQFATAVFQTDRTREPLPIELEALRRQAENAAVSWEALADEVRRVAARGPVTQLRRAGE